MSAVGVRICSWILFGVSTSVCLFLLPVLISNWKSRHVVAENSIPSFVFFSKVIVVLLGGLCAAIFHLHQDVYALWRIELIAFDISHAIDFAQIVMTGIDKVASIVVGIAVGVIIGIQIWDHENFCYTAGLCLAEHSLSIGFRWLLKLLKKKLKITNQNDENGNKGEEEEILSMRYFLGASVVMIIGSATALSQCAFKGISFDPTMSEYYVGFSVYYVLYAISLLLQLMPQLLHVKP